VTTSVETKPVQWSDIVKRIDPAVLVGVTVFTALVVIDPAQIPGSAAFVIRALVEISPFFFLSIGVAAYAKASGAEHLIARVFEGKLKRMIVAAAIFGALSPFCSCGVIPIVAGLLAAGVPLPPVMAFWLASPLMDPEMFIISWAGLGLHFTTAKTLVAIGVGLLGGFATMFVLQRGFFASPLSSGVQSCCKSSCSSTNATPEVECKIWRAPARRAEFRAASLEVGWFLGKKHHDFIYSTDFRRRLAGWRQLVDHPLGGLRRDSRLSQRLRRRSLDGQLDRHGYDAGRGDGVHDRRWCHQHPGSDRGFRPRSC